MSARISIDSKERATVAGWRMLAGTLAAVIVALGTLPIGGWLTGSQGPKAYAAAAGVFAVVGSLMLIAVGLNYREDAVPPARERPPLGQALLLAWRNRAFVTLGAAMSAMIVAVTMLDKSVLYYFKYALNDQAAGQLALGAMMAVSGLAIPAWLVLSRRIGIRAVWFVAIVICAVNLCVFIAAHLATALSVQAFLVIMQIATIGLNFALWAMLPDTVEYGQRAHGVRSEAVLYGYSALLQRLAIGAGTALMGFTLDANAFNRSDAETTAFRLTIALLPLLFLAVSGLLMLLNPLRRGSHDAILRDLEGRAELSGQKLEIASDPVSLR
jgi:GPH family glycoside/pentoside/hexuronide:cation symporter